jgi:hypothetical protein
MNVREAGGVFYLSDARTTRIAEEDSVRGSNRRSDVLLKAKVKGAAS